MDRKKSIDGRHLRPVDAAPPAPAAVDFDPTVAEPAAAPPAVSAKAPRSPRASAMPAPLDWRSSSYDLLNGLEVLDQSDSIPPELFNKLFKR